MVWRDSSNRLDWMRRLSTEAATYRICGNSRPSDIVGLRNRLPGAQNLQMREIQIAWVKSVFDGF